MTMSCLFKTAEVKSSLAYVTKSEPACATKDEMEIYASYLIRADAGAVATLCM